MDFSGGVQALPDSVSRHISVAVDVSDPRAVIKELIDNSLDARATSIAIEIAANTVDAIHVRDNGAGITAEGRPLVARRHCTSKIRCMDDLTRVGGSSLGFRGVALSSIAASSGAMTMTTRVEGEIVATKLHINRCGELMKEEKTSAGVGTVVRLSDYLDSYPVRKKVAIAEAAKTLSEVKRLLQAYALARPTIRLSLRVLNSRSGRTDFTYAPRSGAGAQDAVLKAVGREVGSQCSWSTWQHLGYEVSACLPRTDADATKISGPGTFLSIDSRPVSASKESLKPIEKAIRDRLRLSNQALKDASKPFACLDIRCPVGVYDVNIEPAKDDMLFQDLHEVLAAVNGLLEHVYPERATDLEGGDADPEPFVAQIPAITDQEAPEYDSFNQSHVSSHPDCTGSTGSPWSSHSISRQFHSSMYGCDEDDHLGSESEDTSLRSPSNNEQVRLSSSLSNPWIIAKMNAPLRSQRTGPTKTRLPTPPSSDPVLDQFPSSRTEVGPHVFKASTRGHFSLARCSPTPVPLSLNDTLRAQVFVDRTSKVASMDRFRRDRTIHHNENRAWQAPLPQRERTRRPIRGNRSAMPELSIVPYEDITSPSSRRHRDTGSQLRQSLLNFQTKPSNLRNNSNDEDLCNRMNLYNDTPSSTIGLESLMHPTSSSLSADGHLDMLEERRQATLAATDRMSVDFGIQPRFTGDDTTMNEICNVRTEDHQSPVVHRRRTRSPGLPLESIPATSMIHAVVHKTNISLLALRSQIKRCVYRTDSERAFLTGATDGELQTWAIRLSESLKSLRPGNLEHVDIFDTLRNTVKSAKHLL